MPWHASPKKTLRSDARRRDVRKNRLSALRTTVKKARLAIANSGGEPQERVVLVQSAQSALAKAASRGVLHRKTAARKIGRLMKQAAAVAVVSA